MKPQKYQKQKFDQAFQRPRPLWPPDGTTALVANLATRWHWFKIWSSAGATCIASEVGHQIALFALLHCLGLPYWHYQLVLSWYPRQPESHQLSLTEVSYGLTDIRTPGLPGSDNYQCMLLCYIALLPQRMKAAKKPQRMKAAKNESQPVCGQIPALAAPRATWHGSSALQPVIADLPVLVGTSGYQN